MLHIRHHSAKTGNFQRLVTAFLHIININVIIDSVILIQWAYLFQQGKPYSRFT